MEISKWLEALRKACRMMNCNPSGDIERDYFWLACQRKPKSVSDARLSVIVNDLSNGWGLWTTPTPIGLDKTFWSHEIKVHPKKSKGCELFAEKAGVWVDALLSLGAGEIKQGPQ